MNSKKLRVINSLFIGVSAISLFSVSVMAFYNPQAVMDLVAVKLNNTDAFSSIRGVYGGAALAMVIFLVSTIKQQQKTALFFLSLLWGLYAFSRAVTILVDGPLGNFGTQWIITETILFSIAILLYIYTKHEPTTQQ
jgi:hypothetical protein